MGHKYFLFEENVLENLHHTGNLGRGKSTLLLEYGLHRHNWPIMPTKSTIDLHRKCIFLTALSLYFRK